MDRIVGSTWLKKLEPALLFLIIFLSSSQLGSHFWPSSAFVYGIRIDYLAPTLYFLDVLLVLYLYFFKRQYVTTLVKSPLMTIGLPILLTNVLFSQNPWASLNWLTHIILYLTFITQLPHKFIKLIPYALFSSLLVQLTLAVSQVILGHSVQGIFYYLGERMLSVGQPNVAVGSLMGSVVLRAYGTFSHPNILAGYSVITTLIIIQITKQLAVRRTDLVGLPTRSVLKVLVVTLVTTLIIFRTQSRSAALAFFGFVIPFHLFTSLRSRILYFAFLLIPISIMLKVNLLSRPLDLSISERLSLQQVSGRVIAAYPLFGVGANAGITRYPDLAKSFRLLQPDHNSFTLFLSWFGVIGVVSLLYQFRTLQKQVFGTLFPLLPLLLFDHYLLTSPQGLFILLLYLRVNYWYDLGNQANRQ